jgi:hypothetical protein
MPWSPGRETDPQNESAAGRASHIAQLLLLGWGHPGCTAATVGRLHCLTQLLGCGASYQLCAWLIRWGAMEVDHNDAITGQQVVVMVAVSR